MIVSELWIYPIKSLPGVRVETAILEERGLRDDRRMMVVDEDGRFLTQREIPGMALVSVCEAENGWTLSTPHAGALTIDPESDTGKAASVTVWDSVVQANFVCEAADRWLTRALGRPARLVRMTDASLRPCGDGQVSFADGYPVLIVGQASIDDLNKRLVHKVEMRRFRPNIVIAGATPYEEDLWPTSRIGEAELRATIRCGRCIMTTIDPSTAKTSSEPLRTLATYRKHGKSVDFGMNYVPSKLGAIHVGDPVIAHPN